MYNMCLLSINLCDATVCIKQSTIARPSLPHYGRQHCTLLNICMNWQESFQLCTFYHSLSQKDGTYKRNQKRTNWQSGASTVHSVKSDRERFSWSLRHGTQYDQDPSKLRPNRNKYWLKLLGNLPILCYQFPIFDSLPSNEPDTLVSVFWKEEYKNIWTKQRKLNCTSSFCTFPLDYLRAFLCKTRNGFCVQCV